MKINIESIFHNLRIPSSKNFTCEKFNNSNLWIVKDEIGNCGILINNVEESRVMKDYKNLICEEIPKLRTDDILLKNVFMVRHNDLIIPNLFSESLNSYFSDNLKNEYTINDIKIALDEIEAITKNSKDKLNEIIGAWGELYLLKLLLNSTSKENYRYIINGWESPDGRSLIDIKLNKIKLCIEVKTTTLDARIHHISSIKQVSSSNQLEGFLASICVTEGLGLSCFELTSKINNLLDDENKIIFNNRLKIRGEKLCRNKKYLFKLNGKKTPRFFEFDVVPKPSISEEILKIEWDMTLENIFSLDEPQFLKKIKF